MKTKVTRNSGQTEFLGQVVGSAGIIPFTHDRHREACGRWAAANISSFGGVTTYFSWCLKVNPGVVMGQNTAGHFHCSSAPGKQGCCWQGTLLSSEVRQGTGRQLAKHRCKGKTREWDPRTEGVSSLSLSPQLRETSREETLSGY